MQNYLDTQKKNLEARYETESFKYFLCVSKHFLVSETQQTTVKVILYLVHGFLQRGLLIFRSLQLANQVAGFQSTMFSTADVLTKSTLDADLPCLSLQSHCS